MAPRRFLSSAHIARGASDVQPTFSAQKSSWQNPENILDILMLIGGDIVQRAVAQLAGRGDGHHLLGRVVHGSPFSTLRSHAVKVSRSRLIFSHAR